jgi:hypothetical protein
VTASAAQLHCQHRRHFDQRLWDLLPLLVLLVVVPDSCRLAQ